MGEKECKSSSFLGNAGKSNVICYDPKICTRLTVSKEFLSEKKSFQQETILKILQVNDDEIENRISSYGRPVYVEDKKSTSNSARLHYYLVLFSGRRWIATNTK